MKMLRYYFISDDLDDLESFEEQLENAGLMTEQIHVLSLDDTEVENHVHLHDVQSLMKKDLIHSAEYGAVIGACLAGAVLLAAYTFGWNESPAGWMPFIFLAIICLGFFTWEGGLWGIQNTNVHFKRFETVLNDGKHVFFIDVEKIQEDLFKQILADHPRVEAAGTGTANPHWIVIWQYRLKRLFGETLP
jgi:hypothetical protein